ncbi:tetratricopeptide repeat protein, partial [Romboutsia sp.]|uniref:tetratricopeptide repeat protein n=1 Tax=Romboutsia sp. TaxID=1965302 RepID=UPI003F3A57E6
MKFEDFNEEVEKLKNDDEYIKILCHKISFMNPKKEKEICEKLMDFARLNNLESIYPWVLINLGWANLNLGNVIIAEKMHIKAYAIFKKTNNIQGLLSVINALLVDYYSMEAFDKAIEYGVEGLELAEKEKNYERSSAIIGNMAAIYVDIEEYEKAKILLNQIEKLPYISNRDNEINNYINFAVTECKTNNLDKAMEYIQKAYETGKIYEPNLLPRILKEMGMICAIKGMYEIAEDKFIESINIARERECNRYGKDILLYWAELDLMRGRYENAILKLKEAESKIEKLGLKLTLNKIYLCLSKAYGGLDDYKEAYLYLRKRNELEKEINKIKNGANMKSLDSKKEQQEINNYKLLYKQTEALYGVGQRITSNLDKENVFNIITKEIEGLIECNAVEIAVYKKEDIYEYQLCMRNGKKSLLNSTEIHKDSFMGYCIYNNQDILIHDFYNEYNQYI